MMFARLPILLEKIQQPPGDADGWWQEFIKRGQFSNGSTDDGWLVEQLKKAASEIGQMIKDGLITFLSDLAKGTVYMLSPFVEWGAKSAICIIFLAVYCSDGADKKLISKGVIIFIIYVLFMGIRGVMLR